MQNYLKFIAEGTSSHWQTSKAVTLVETLWKGWWDEDDKIRMTMILMLQCFSASVISTVSRSIRVSGTIRYVDETRNWFCRGSKLGSIPVGRGSLLDNSSKTESESFHRDETLNQITKDPFIVIFLKFCPSSRTHQTLRGPNTVFQSTFRISLLVEPSQIKLT